MVAIAEIPEKVVAMAEILKKGGCYSWNSLKRCLLWLKFLKRLMALAEIPKEGGCSGWNS